MASPTIIGTPLTYLSPSSLSVYTTGSFTMPSSGQNEALIVIVASGNGQPANTTGVKWQGSTGTPMTNVVAVNGSQQSGGSVWFLANPTVATDVVEVTRNISSGDTEILVFALQDCKQSSPVDTSNFSSGGTGTSATVSLTTNFTNEFILVWGVGDPWTSPVPNGSQSTISTIARNTTGRFTSSWVAQPTAASITPGMSWTGSSSYDLYAAGFQYVAPSGGSNPTYRTLLGVGI